jgi:xanthine dehydrogenase small subunit
LDKDPDEYIELIRFNLPQQSDRFHFEKVCKRTHLDIASVNTALMLRMENGLILEAGLSAGGVAPVPYYLQAASAFLSGKRPEPAIVDECIRVAQSEIAPISDARGTADYKRLLLSQLIRAHFMEMFPEVFNDKTVLA